MNNEPGKMGDPATRQDISMLKSEIDHLRSARSLDVGWIRCLLFINLLLSALILMAAIKLLE